MEEVSGAREIGRREGAKEGERLRKGKREGKGRGVTQILALESNSPTTAVFVLKRSPDAGHKVQICLSIFV